jgi:putative ubiquitin-RnfH superfamily antitoxin RatB of RatAB toxin-antitoxin module
VKVSIAYATRARQLWHDLELPAGTTVRRAVELSGIIAEFPEIDLTKNRVGIFGEVVSPEKVLEEGDRVEIYRPLIASPRLARKKKNQSS